MNGWPIRRLGSRSLSRRTGGPEFGYLDDIAESPEFTGHVIAPLHADPDVPERSGPTLIGAEVALQHGITDRGGRQPPSYRDLMNVKERHPLV